MSLSIDYYPFGSPISSRKWQANSSYRYGFNGKENDNEVVGTGSGTQDYGFRIYNPSLGKFLSVDPLSPKFPYYTPYQFAGNKPIECIDLDGTEDITYLYVQNKTGSGYTMIKKFDFRTTKEGHGDLGHGIQVIFINRKGVVFKEFLRTDKYSTETELLANKIGRMLEKPAAKVQQYVPKGDIKNAYVAQGGADGANVGTLTPQDQKVGLAIVGTVAGAMTMGVGLAAVGTLSGLEVATTVGGGVSMLNGIDDAMAATNRNNESFSVSLTDNEEYKARIDNVKVGLTVSTLVLGGVNAVKTPGDIVNWAATANDAKATVEATVTKIQQAKD